MLHPNTLNIHLEPLEDCGEQELREQWTLRSCLLCCSQNKTTVTTIRVMPTTLDPLVYVSPWPSMHPGWCHAWVQFSIGNVAHHSCLPCISQHLLSPQWVSPCNSEGNRDTLNALFESTSSSWSRHVHCGEGSLVPCFKAFLWHFYLISSIVCDSMFRSFVHFELILMPSFRSWVLIFHMRTSGFPSTIWWRGHSFFYVYLGDFSQE